MTSTSDAMAVLISTLERELGPGNEMHGWRCSHPDRWPGPCDCALTMAGIIRDDLAEAGYVIALQFRPVANVNVNYANPRFGPNY